MRDSRRIHRDAERGDPTAWKRLWGEDGGAARRLAAGLLVRSMKASPRERLWSVGLPDAFGRSEGIRLSAFSPLLNGDVFAGPKLPLRIFITCERPASDKRALDHLFLEPAGVTKRVTQAGEVHGETLGGGWDEEVLFVSAGSVMGHAWELTSRAAALCRLVEAFSAAYSGMDRARAIPRARRIAADLGLPAVIELLNADDILRIADETATRNAAGRT